MLFAAIVLWCVLRGLCEGLVMNVTGVRNHPWFRWYHLLCIARDGGLVAVVLAAYHIANVSIMIAAGAVVLGWEMFEAAYNYTRYKRFITGHDNVLGVYQLTNPDDTWPLHSGRILIGCGLLLWGLK